MTDTLRLDTRELDRIAAGLKVNKRDVIRAFAFEVEAEAKTLAPLYEFGALENSIYTNVQGGGGSQPEKRDGINYVDIPEATGDIIAVVGTGIEYGIYQELGTSRMGAQPFLGPAVEDKSHDLNSGAMWEKLFK